MTLALTMLQALATILIAATLLVYWFQLGVMRNQLAVMRSGANAQNFLSLVQYLQAPDRQEARRVVIQELLEEPFEQWKEDEKYCRTASVVCSTYDVVAIVIREDFVAAKPIIENWGPSIKRCYRACEELIQDRRSKNGSEYWDDFEWLYEQARNHSLGGESEATSVSA
jgi:hypothetical protein